MRKSIDHRQDLMGADFVHGGGNDASNTGMLAADDKAGQVRIAWRRKMDMAIDESHRGRHAP
jgi:hypothetical protein